MPAPDVNITIGSAATPRTIPVDTGQCFAVGQTQRGSIVKPFLLRSMADYTQYHGLRQTSSVMSDWAETYFAEGGTKLYISRKYGVGATQATLNLLDGSAGVSLVVKAGILGDPDPGTWANGAGGLSVAVVANGSNYQIQTYLNGVFVESSPILVTQADAVGWSNHPTQGSKYITISLGASSLVPAVAGVANLASGTDGSATIASDQQNAIDRCSQLFGPGQICAPGATDSTSQLQLIAHAVANNYRWPLLDGPDTSTAATLVTAAAALYGAPTNGRRWAQLLAPWDVIPGLTQYMTRTVPPSARQAAQYARVDALGNPNQAAAGHNGIAQFVQDLSQPNFVASDRKLLNEAGVTLSRRRYAGVIATYGARNLADQVADRDWSWAPNIRTIMAYVARAYAVGENHEFNNIDGQGRELSAFKADLTGPLLDLFSAGALYGGSPVEAFYVDVGPGINTPSQLALNIMAANVKLRTSPGAESVNVSIIKTPVTQSV